jgi:two-component system, OmpR family, response regulator
VVGSSQTISSMKLDPLHNSIGRKQTMSKPRLILIVDDDPHIREVVRFALENAGFITAQAADGREAVEQFLAVRPDLVVLDILMPEMDGTEVCRQIRLQSVTPIIFLSSRDEEVDRIVGLELGGDDYVTKPFSPRELVARVKAVLRRANNVQKSTSQAEKASDSQKFNGMAAWNWTLTGSRPIGMENQWCSPSRNSE